MFTKKTKIVATIGPVSASKEILKEMIMAGMNVARINFSHGTHESNGKVIDIIRKLSEEMNVPVGVMADLQGPKIRVGNENEFEIKTGEKILVSDKKTSDGEKELVIDSPGVVATLEVGERIFIEDGIMELKVSERKNSSVLAEVLNGGTVKPRKGINVPDTKLRFGALSEKDEKDLEYVLGKDIDFVALSFVSNAKEIEDVREKMRTALGRMDNLPQIVSKIERKAAIKNIDEIVKASDVIMVARGDLGIELNETKVVIYQKEIISKCLEIVKPVIVATQMLDSMINNPIPTRAEVSDVSNAVIDHADAVMLSGESASGKYPVEAVRMMSNIIRNTEESRFDDINSGFLDDDIFSDYASIIDSAHEMAKNSNADAILMSSTSGFTARMMSHHRPEQLMLVSTNNPKTYNQLSIVWGIESYLFKNEEDSDKLVDLMTNEAKNDKRIQTGDKAVIIMGRIPGGKRMQLAGIQKVE